MTIEKLRKTSEESDWRGVIAQYLVNRCESDKELLEHIEQTEDKDIDRCCDYIVSEARTKTTGKACCMKDEDVFNLAVHYFLEYGKIKFNSVGGATVKTAKSKAKEENEEEKPKEVVKAKAKAKPKSKALSDSDFQQVDMFSFLNEETEEENEEEWEDDEE